MEPKKLGKRRSTFILVALATAALLAGCGGAGAGGGDGGDGNGAGYETVPAASDLQIYVPQLSPFALNLWPNSSGENIEDFWGNYTDLDGDGLMEVTVSGAPPVGVRWPASEEFPMPGFVTYSDGTVAGYAIMEFYVVDSNGDDTGYVSLQDLVALESASPSNFTGELHYYEFWWVEEDLTITGQDLVSGVGGMGPMVSAAPLPDISFTANLDLRAGWNVVKIIDEYDEGDLVAETLVVAPISSTARWIWEGALTPVVN